MTKWIFTIVAALFCSLAQAGTWGKGSFENDAALDWGGDCVDGFSLRELNSALALPAKTIDDWAGSSAVAAAEVVAAAMGKPSKHLPSSLRVWLAHQSKADIIKLLPKARAALVRIKNRKESELAQLWAGPGEDEWLAQINELEARLKK